MKLPFVSRARFDLLQHNFDEARTHFRIERGATDAEIALLREQIDQERAERRDLMEKYHALRVDGHAPPAPTPFVAEQFGPLTRAALFDMGHGQSGIVTRAMRTKAAAIWAQHAGRENCDEIVSIAVRQGEVTIR